MARAWALLEVGAAFAATHVAMRSFRQLTELGRLEREAGLNVSPGVFMALAALILIRLSGRGAGEHGLVAEIWPAPGAPRAAWKALGLAALAFLCLVPLARAWLSGAELGLTAARSAGRFFAVGFGEELFFRAYVQSRLNRDFGRPFEFQGARWGWGLPLAAALFGVLHVLNTVDYFGGLWQPAWLWGMGTLAAGLVFGYLRERSGGVLFPALVHAGRGLLSPLGASAPAPFG